MPTPRPGSVWCITFQSNAVRSRQFIAAKVTEMPTTNISYGITCSMTVPNCSSDQSPLTRMRGQA